LLAQQRQIVDSAIDQLHCAVRAAKTILQAAADVQGVDSASETKQVLDAQQAYISHSQEVQRLIKKLQELQPGIAALGEQGIHKCNLLYHSHSAAFSHCICLTNNQVE
jgi:uncharacterized protein YpbB